jgi:hypothetical protein
MGLGSVFAFRDLPVRLGFDMQRRLVGWEMLWVTVIAILVMVFLLYLGAIAWLLFARLFLSKAEVSKVVFYGPTTRFERWLVDALFQQQR